MKGKRAPKRNQKVVSYFKTGDSRYPQFQVRIYLPRRNLVGGRRPFVYLATFAREIDAQIACSLVKVELAFEMLVRDIGFAQGKALLEYLDFVGQYVGEVQRGRNEERWKTESWNDSSSLSFY